MPVKSFITSDAIINPADEGTKDTEPGMALLLPSCFSSSISMGFKGISFEYKTFSELIPLSFNSLRITFAKGQTEVL